jgi:hypothetical protein
MSKEREEPRQVIIIGKGAGRLNLNRADRL